MSSSPKYKVENSSKFSKEIQNLLREAHEARSSSYSPYSKFGVGAAVLCEDNKVFRGCNIENAAFPIGICAEKVAFGAAVCSGRRKFKAVAIVATSETGFTTPCGGCRQFMSEFGNVDLYLSKPELEDVLSTSLNYILPLQFEARDDFTF